MSDYPDLHPDWSPSDGPLPGDLVICSASSIADVPSKPQLEEWRAKETATRVVEEWAMLTELLGTDPQAAWRWIRDGAYHAHRDKLNARERGTVIHAHFESWFPPYPTPPVAPEYLHPLIAQLARWVEETQFAVELSEEVVWRDPRDLIQQCPNPQAREVGIMRAEVFPGLAGRLDTCGRLMAGVPDEYRGKLGLIDIKTMEQDRTGDNRKRRPYPDSVTLQLASYFFADHVARHRVRTVDKGRKRLYCFSEQERALAEPAPRFDYAAVLLVTPERAELYPVNLTDEHLDAALAAARLYWHGASVKGYLGRSIIEVTA